MLEHSALCAAQSASNTVSEPTVHNYEQCKQALTHERELLTSIIIVYRINHILYHVTNKAIN